jgi:hypothetical protein
MHTKEQLEHEKTILESALRIFMIRDPVIADRVQKRILKIEEDLKNGNYKDFEDRSG